MTIKYFLPISGIAIAACATQQQEQGLSSAEQIGSEVCLYASEPFAVGTITRQPMRKVEEDGEIELVQDPDGIPMRCEIENGHLAWVRVESDSSWR